MKLVTLKNDYMEVTLCDVGASIFRLLFDGYDMLVGPKDIDDFLRKDLYFGKTIGRICGRIKNDKGEIVLHGGIDGLSNQTFNCVKEDNKVIFTYLSKGDQSSSDGDALIKVTYTLLDKDLLIELEATPKGEATLSLTNHSYFCLGEDDVHKLSLKMDSDRYFVYDESLFPLGSEDVSSKFDFHKLLPTREYGDIDTYFYLNSWPVLLRGSKYQLEVSSDFEGTVVYTDNFEDDTKTFMSSKNKYRGIAIEPQMDSFKRKPLHKGEVLKHYIRFSFKKL